MPIPDTILIRTLIPRILTPSTTVAELLYLLAEQPKPSIAYAVVRMGPGAYDVLALDDLRDLADQRGAALLPLALGAIAGLLRAGEPLVQSQVGQARAEREMHDRHHRRLVVLDDDGAVVGILAATMLAVPRGGSPLELIEGPAPLVLGEPEPPPPAPPSLNTRFDGVAPNAPLVVGRRVPLIVSVGAPTANNAAQSSRQFTFDFAGVTEPMRFTVSVDADPDLWTIRIVEPTMVVASPGATQQEAEFTVIAKQPGRSSLLLSVARADTGATVQKVWLWVTATVEPLGAAAPSFVQPAIAVTFPLDVGGLERPAVELTIQTAGAGGAMVVVRADLPDGQVRDTFPLPVSGAAIQTAASRLRAELKKIVYYQHDSGAGTVEYPFANIETNQIDPAIARQACVPLAEAGRIVWDTIFRAPRGELRQLAESMRSLPHGSRVQIILDSQEFIVPWALMYDAPGAITAQSLDWSGFWGYRYIVDVLPPGAYPPPTIGDTPLGMLLLFNDDERLRQFTAAQEQFIRTTLSGARADTAWGHKQVRQALLAPSNAALIYCYCHGEHESGAVAADKLANESALLFGPGQRLRVVDLRDLPAAPLAHRPLVFLNACEGATQDAFYYDGFMPFFIEQQRARGFIGAEVKAPQLLGHDVALQFLRMFAEGRPVGEILWTLRRHYIDKLNNILAFNYSLYCPAETRLATPLIPGAPAANATP